MELNQNLISIKQERNKKEFRNFFVLYGINLNLTLKNLGVILSGVFFLIMAIVFFSLETFSAVQENDLSNYSLYKALSYIFLSGSIIFQVLLTSLYLFKKQLKDGITAIELRAGYKAWKSFLIRFLIIISVLWIYITIALLIVVVLHLISGANTEIFASLLYSQIFYLYFLSLISTLILTAIMIICTTAIATSLGMVFICLVALGPIFSSLSLVISSSSQIQTNYLANIKLKAGSDFYNEFKGNEALFNDEDQENGSEEYPTSKFLKTINSNIANAISPLVETGQNTFENYLNYLDNKSLLNSVPSYMLENTTDREYLNEMRILNMLTKNLMSGQILYDYNLYSDENSEPIYILEGTPLWDFLYEINTEVLNNDSNYSSDYSGEIPDVLAYEQNYSNQPSITTFVDIQNFTSELISNVPEYNSLLKHIEKFYNEYSMLLASATGDSGYFSLNQILDIFAINVSYNNNSLFTWKDSFYNKDYDNFDYVCQENKNISRIPQETIELCKNSKAIEHNDNVSEMYKKHPELAIVNAIAINLWKEAMVFDLPNGGSRFTSDINQGLYNYYNESATSNSLTTDIFRHFSAMSSGVFTSPLINDGYNSKSSIIYQGQTVSIKNIFDFENQAPTNKKPMESLSPVYENKELSYKNAFIIPLAYFVYLLIASPLGYIAYFVFNKKAKL